MPIVINSINNSLKQFSKKQIQRQIAFKANYFPQEKIDEVILSSKNKEKETIPPKNKISFLDIFDPFSKQKERIKKKEILLLENKAKPIQIPQRAASKEPIIHIESYGEMYTIKVDIQGKKANLRCFEGHFNKREASTFPKEYLDYEGKIHCLYISHLVGEGSGTGTEAIKEAIKLSDELGLDGKVGLEATIINRFKKTPIPFYYKLGFKCPVERIQEEIEEGMENLKTIGHYTGPKSATLYLPKDKIEEYLKNN